MDSLEEKKEKRTMKTNHILIALVLLVALALVGCSAENAPVPAVPEGAQAGDLVGLQPCTYKAGETEYAADCGTLVVPENRSDPDSRLIALPLIRVRARSESPVEPIFYLQGGPGGSNQHFQYLDGLVDDHDLIQVGYRGVDGSVLLDCPEIAEAVRKAPDVLGDAALDSYGDASARCAQRLQAEGVDLARYTMTEVIDDMEAARVALGYERINLLGESYGTRLEMIYEWMYPESLQRVIMVAVNPPGHFIWEPEAIDAQLEDYAELCARDAACSTRTDDLMASLRHVSENMPERWLIFPIDADGVKMFSFFMLMESIQPPGMPVPLSGPAMIDMWLAAEKGDASGMALVSLTRNMFLPDMFVYGDLLVKGGSGGDFARHAADYRVALNPPGSILGSGLSLYHSALGAGWPIHLIPEEYLPMQSTAVQTLLVSGSIDFSTPPQFATEELLPYLNNGEQVTLKDFAHTETFWNRQAEARTHLLTTFYSTGEVDDSLYTYEAVDFDQGPGWPALAKRFLAIVLALIVLLVALVWFVARRVQGRRTTAAGPALRNAYS
jgi:pimeloyl-ACP methyl ester carboxylesterase